MSKTYPKKLGQVTPEDIVYYLEEKYDGPVNSLGTKVPDAPTTAGTYVLTATVSSSGAVYSWESTAEEETEPAATEPAATEGT